MLGSSLTVTPAADMPKIVGRRGRLVIVNLQKTPLYKLAKLNIHGRCDVVMTAVMEKLAIDIPPFILRRKINISHRWLYPAAAAVTKPTAAATGGADSKSPAPPGGASSADSKSAAPYTSGVNIRMWAVDVDEPQLPATMIKTATIGVGEQTGEPVSLKAMYSVTARWEPDAEAPPATANIKLGFYGHYNEPELALAYPLTLLPPGTPASATTTVSAGSGGVSDLKSKDAAAAAAVGAPPVIGSDGTITNQYNLRFSPQTGQWAVEQTSGVPQGKSITPHKPAPSAAASGSGGAGGAPAKESEGGAFAAISSFFGIGKKPAAPAPAPTATTGGSGGGKIKLTASVLNKFTITESFDVANNNSTPAAAAGDMKSGDTKSAGSGGGASSVDTPASAGGLAAGGMWGSTNLVSDMKDRPVIVCCGGLGERERQSSKAGFISVFELDTKRWRPLPEPAGKSIPYLSKNRWGHTGTVVSSRPDQIFLIGGFDSECQYTDVCRYDVKTHTITECDTKLTKGLNLDTDSFTPRAHHSAIAIDADTIFVFGGSVCVGGPYKYHNDCFTYKVSTGVWTKFLTKGDAPSPRAQHTALLIPRGGFNGHGNSVLIMGGENGKNILSDAYALALGNFNWTQIQISASSPQAIPLRDAHTAALNAQKFRVTHARHSAVILPTAHKSSAGSGGSVSEDATESGDGTIKVFMSGLQNSSESGLLVITPGQPMSVVTGPFPSYQWGHKIQPSKLLALGGHLITTGSADGTIIGWGGQSADKSRANSELIFAKITE